MSRDLHVIDGGDPIRHQAAAWFARLRADDLSESERCQWQAWMDADPRHRAGYQRLELLWSGLGAHAPAREIAERLDAIGSGGGGNRGGGGDNAGSSSGGRPTGLVPSRRAAGRRRFALATAAMLGLAAIGAWQWWPAAGDSAPLQYATDVGEQRRLTLKDGTRVTLDTDTRLHVAYTAQERRLVLDKGRAFFEVAKGRRPLVVYTAHGGVRAVGTEFEVYRHDHSTEVALVEGEVLLSGASAATEPLPMQAGHRASLRQDTDVPQVKPLHDTHVPPWLSGRLVFENTALPEVVAEFNRYSRRPMVLGDAQLADIHITGVFRSDGMHAFIGALRDAYPVSVDGSQPEVVRLVRVGGVGPRG